MSSELVQKTADYVKLKLYNEPTGHDWYHVERVWRTARGLQAEEGGDLELLELAALLHDLGDYKHYDLDQSKGFLVLRAMMDILGIEEEREEKIITIVDEAQYNGTETQVPQTIEGKILQDADWLDAIGAIGIARTFATGGQIKRVIHDPRRNLRQRLSKEAYRHRKIEGTSFNYFYEKILKLPEMMNTKTGKALATERAKFVEQYMQEFLAEWEGKK